METNEIKRPSGYIVIPPAVRYNKQLPDGAKLLYGEVIALCNNAQSCCWAKNEYFAEVFARDVSTVGRWIAKLADLGYITVNLLKDEKNAIVERRIYNALAVCAAPIAQDGENESVRTSGRENNCGSYRGDSDGILGVRIFADTPCATAPVETMTITITKPAQNTPATVDGRTEKTALLPALGGVRKNAERVSAKTRTGYPQKCGEGVRKNAEDNNYNLRINNINKYNKNLVFNNNARAGVRVTAAEFDFTFQNAMTACSCQQNEGYGEGYGLVRDFLLKKINGGELELLDLSEKQVCGYVSSLYKVNEKKQAYYRRHISNLDAYLEKCLAGTREENTRKNCAGRGIFGWARGRELKAAGTDGLSRVVILGDEETADVLAGTAPEAAQVFGRMLEHQALSGINELILNAWIRTLEPMGLTERGRLVLRAPSAWAKAEAIQVAGTELEESFAGVSVCG